MDKTKGSRISESSSLFDIIGNNDVRPVTGMSGRQNQNSPVAVEAVTALAPDGRASLFLNMESGV